VLDLRQAAAKGVLYSRSRLSANPMKTLRVRSLDRPNDQRVWPHFLVYLVDPVINWPDWSQGVTLNAGKEPAL